MRNSQYSILLIAASLLFSTVTNFRFGPIGLPEIFGLLAIIFSLRNFRILLSSTFITYQLIIFFILLSLILGSLFTIAFEYSSVSVRDWMAWIYIIFFISSIIVSINANNESIILILRILSLMPLMFVFILFAGSIGLVNIWFADEEGFSVPLISRFTGLSTNPNQVGIAISALPFLCIYSFLKLKRGLLSQLYLFFNLSVLLFLAIIVASNTVIVSWVIGFSVAFIFYIKNLLSRSPLFAVALLIPILALCIVSFDLFVPYLNKGDDFNGRSAIWGTVSEIFFHSPVVGHGPGPHGGIGIPFEGWELHSVPLDLLSQGGLILIITFIVMIFYNYFLALKLKSSIIWAIFFATLIESLTHNAIRHPIFWFYILFPYFVFLSSRLR